MSRIEPSHECGRSDGFDINCHPWKWVFRIGGLLFLVWLLAKILLPDGSNFNASVAQNQSRGNLSHIRLGLEAYEDKNGFLPPAAITDKEGRPLLSWRVAIIPYIEDEE